jgi:hypothetical protein
MSVKEVANCVFEVLQCFLAAVFGEWKRAILDGDRDSFSIVSVLSMPSSISLLIVEYLVPLGENKPLRVPQTAPGRSNAVHALYLWRHEQMLVHFVEIPSHQELVDRPLCP